MFYRWACHFGYADLVELLTSKGADTSLVSDTARTPMEMTQAMDLENLSEILKNHGARK